MESVWKHEVESFSTAGKTYLVTKKGDAWSCSCPHWIYRRKECKHIQEAKAYFVLEVVPYEQGPVDKPSKLSDFMR